MRNGDRPLHEARLNVFWCQQHARDAWRAFARYHTPILRDEAQHWDRETEHWQHQVNLLSLREEEARARAYANAFQSDLWNDVADTLARLHSKTRHAREEP